jgi:DNA-binding MarR family transcriptional regulator
MDIPEDVPTSAIAVRIVATLYKELEQAARASDLSLAQYRLLFYMQGGAKRAGAIAVAASLAKPTISLTLNSLREKGWVENVPDPDGRASVVVLTAAGEARLAAFEAELSAAMRAMLEDDGAYADLETGLMAAYRALDAKLSRALAKKGLA